MVISTVRARGPIVRAAVLSLALAAILSFGAEARPGPAGADTVSGQDTVAPPERPPAKGSRRPQSPARNDAGPRATTAVPMSVGDCTALSGRVQKDGTGLCKLGLSCGRTDADGNMHLVCITDLSPI